MSILRKWMGAPSTGSGNVAKDRLRLVLVHDRLELAPEALESLKKDLLDVIGRYFDADPGSIAVDVQRGEQRGQLVTTISVKKQD